MSSINIRNLDESVKTGLRLRAARHGWSMAQEIRHILQQAISTEKAAEISFADRINSRFIGLNVESTDIPVRQITRTTSKFEAP